MPTAPPPAPAPPEAEVRAWGRGRHGRGSAVVAALGALPGRGAGVHGPGRAGAAPAAEVWPGDPIEAPRQPAQGAS